MTVSLQITHEDVFSQPNSFLAIILQLPTQLNSKLISLQAGVSNSTLHFSTSVLSCRTLHYNHFSQTLTENTVLYYQESLFTDRCLAINILLLREFACVGMCLRSRCLAMGILITPSFEIGRFVIRWKFTDGFGETYSLHLQGRRISQGSIKQSSYSLSLCSYFRPLSEQGLQPSSFLLLVGLNLYPEDVNSMCLRNVSKLLPDSTA
jgi:hypothetical protein